MSTPFPKIFIAYTWLLLIFPNPTLAGGVTGVVTSIRTDLGWFITVGIGIGMVLFIAGMISFLAASGDEKAHEQGRQRMVWGIVALFFMVSIWGIVSIIQGITGASPTPTCNPTTINVDGLSIDENC